MLGEVVGFRPSVAFRNVALSTDALFSRHSRIYSIGVQCLQCLMAFFACHADCREGQVRASEANRLTPEVMAGRLSRRRRPRAEKVGRMRSRVTRADKAVAYVCFRPSISSPRTGIDDAFDL